jgi:hypothetical protein
MTKLSDTQAVILSAAAQREDRNVLPLPGSLRGGAAAKVVGALLSRGLIAETTTDSRQGRRRAQPDLAQRRGRPRHPPAHHGRGPRRHRRRAGGGDSAPTGADERRVRDPEGRSRRPTPRPRRAHRAHGTKQAKLIEMLRADGGATIDEMVTALDWQAAHDSRRHVRRAEKKLGLTITSEKVEGRGRAYMIAED